MQTKFSLKWFYHLKSIQNFTRFFDTMLSFHRFLFTYRPVIYQHRWKTWTKSTKLNYKFWKKARVWEARRIFRREISKPLCRFSIVSICSSSTYPWNNNFGKINRWIVVSIHTIFFFTVTEFIEIKVHASNIPHFVLDSRFLDTSMTSGSSGGGAGANEAQSCSKRDIRLLLYGTRQWMCQSMVQ